MLAGALLVWLAAAAPSAADTPSFDTLEDRYPHDTRLAKAQEAAQMDLARATLRVTLPAGMPVDIAQARLIAGGATCRPGKPATDTVRCLFHRYDLGDGAANDIRWTVTLRIASGLVADLAVDRYVDRHGSD